MPETLNFRIAHSPAVSVGPQTTPELLDSQWKDPGCSHYNWVLQTTLILLLHLGKYFSGSTQRQVYLGHHHSPTGSFQQAKGMWVYFSKIKPQLGFQDENVNLSSYASPGILGVTVVMTQVFWGEWIVLGNRTETGDWEAQGKQQQHMSIPNCLTVPSP